MSDKVLTPFQATEKDMSKINSYSRRKLNPNEIYTFSMILCSNEIDRDCEAFTKESLIKMATLFQGTTGIFDHKASSKNQIARIFKTSIIKTSEQTTYKSSKYLLKAWAYMLKNENSKDLILKIDAGIVKEISISCNIEKKLCSICNNSYDGSCNHVLGRQYDGNICYVKLVNPYDAYEWSFVAVPAQTDAGILKHFTYNSNANNQLEKNASIGVYYENRLKAEIIKLSFLNGFMTKNNCFKDIVNKLSIKELEALKEEFSENLNKNNTNLKLKQTLKNKESKNLDYVI